MKTTIQKLEGEWYSGYRDEEGVIHFLASEKTKDALIHTLAHELLKAKGFRKE